LNHYQFLFENMLIEDLKVVIKVSELLSITAAANYFNVRAATASAAVKRVEKNVGVELFVRTTRQLRLSAAGERYVPQCKQALQTLKQANQRAKDEMDIVDGELRLAISSDLGRNIVLPWVDEFMDTYPEVSVKINLSDSNVDLYRDYVDMALRYGAENSDPQSNANLYGFKICDVPIVLCASKTYLTQNGEPTEIDDLKSHNGLFYQLYDQIHDVWEFTDGKLEYKVKMKGNQSSNDGDLVRKWCVASKGLAIKSCLDMSNELLSGQVVNVLPDYKSTSNELWLVFPNRQAITPAARLFKDMLQNKTTAIIEQLIAKNILMMN